MRFYRIVRAVLAAFAICLFRLGLADVMIRPKVADALSYLDQVKARFSNQNAIYNDFLDVMRQFKAQTIGTDVVIRRVRELFDGHQDLIIGFNTFIPQGYRLESPAATSKPLNISLCTVGQAYSSEISPGKLPSFSAFRHPDVSSHETIPSSSSTISYQPMPQTSENIFYTSAVGQPPVLRSQLTTSDSQQHPLPHNYQHISTPDNQPIIESHMVYPSNIQSSHQQQSYVPNVQQQQQQQQHNAQSFNHAIIYVNKVKNRFQAKPDVYKCFLEILQWYQREQEHIDTHRRKQAEMQVYQDVAKLLHGHEDLLQEFSRFLPESTSMASDPHDTGGNRNPQYCSVSELSSAAHNRFPASGAGVVSDSSSTWHRNPPESVGQSESKKLKRMAAASSSVQSYSQGELIPLKKPRQTPRDVSLLDVGVAVTGPEATLLQKIRTALDADNAGRYYQSLLQNINLYNRKLIDEKYLIEASNSVLHRYPELHRQFCDMFILPNSESRSSETGAKTPDLDAGLTPSGCLQNEDAKRYPSNNSVASPPLSDVGTTTGGNNIHPLTGADMVALVSEVSQRRLDLDFNKLRTCGASYRALPPNFPQPKCSGRAKSAIARAVLNDTYISFSSLTSEDSQFVSSKKNQYEENMYHTEDERYEADMVMEVNRSAMQNLVVVRRRLDRMSRDEIQSFRLDDYLGGTSAILMKKAIHRVYGDKAGDVIYGLKTCPHTVVPIVIQRMVQKESEWKEALRKFQQYWADQDAKNYLRSLDHQGANFKQRDTAFTRPKAVVNLIEGIARGENSASSDPISGDVVGAMLAKCMACCPPGTNSVSPATLGSALSHVIEGVGDNGGMHLTLEYPPPETCALLLQDVSSLIIHHVKRQSNTSKEDKRTMKFLVRTVLQDFFMQERFPMSDDEGDDEDCENNEDYGVSENEASGDSETVMDTGDSTASGMPKRPRRMRHQTRHPRLHEPANGLKEVSPIPSEQPDLKMRRRSKRKTSNTGGNDSGDRENPLEFPKTPVTANDIPSRVPTEEYYCVLNGNNQWYAFLRLHHLLLTRLSQLRARSQLMQQEYAGEGGKSNNQVADVLRLRKKGQSEPKEYYSLALQLVKDLLDGCEDVHSYEDRLRDMFGIYAYPWFTMDRLITNLVRQLHVLASGDDLSQQLTSLFRCYFKNPNNRLRIDSDVGVAEYDGRNFSPVINGICGPLRTRYSRLKDEAHYQQAAFSAYLEVAVASNDDSGGLSNVDNVGSGAQPTFPSRSQVPNCYTLVMLRQASKLLIRLHDPTYVINTCVAAQQNPPEASAYSPPPRIIPPPSPGEEARAASALKRAEVGDEHEIRHWYDYLARYLLIPGCWMAGPVSAALIARVRPVFLYRNVRRCVEQLTRQAVERKKEEAIATVDPQPEEVLLNSLAHNTSKENEESTTQVDSTSAEQENLEKDTWEVMARVLRNSLSRSEVFRDTYSSDCMQSSKTMKSGNSAPKATYKINWSVGSYGIFIRTRKNRCTQSSTKLRSVKKFREFQASWLSEHGNKTEIEAITMQLKRRSNASDEPEPASEGLDSSQGNETLPSPVKEPPRVIIAAGNPGGEESASKISTPVGTPSESVKNSKQPEVSNY
ncbi:paired amphipathic helix protein sin3b [Echinococcus multilocularis]|uniref:Paired amphipathic helix protein sin3b n=1 Tax=Echinococcus multilocularis TaxID=6211 RepID=A0A068Y6F7_ECHMU|nr:paired amphipathic helix protein sin3b [Echinococcus multilocularis]